jgi:nucleotidyltransferase AbiEii toxin of type IV toxin-antitoxin system
VAVDGLKHRISHDLDFHTKSALLDVRPILAEVQQAFGEDFEVLQIPDSFGSGFSGVLSLPSGASITLEVLSNYQDTPESDLVDCQVEPAFTRVNLPRYLADKVQCVAERAEARDLVDILAVINSDPDLERVVREVLKAQDAVLLVERLLMWSDELVTKDLAGYPDVQPSQAIVARDILLRFLKEDGLL